MLGPWRSWVLLVALVGCGGAQKPVPETPKAPPPPKPAPVVETADLSPVSAPSGLFVVGRLKRPTALTDTLAHWAGVPFGLRDLLPFATKDLDKVIAWDAPVELAVAVAPNGHRGGVDAGLSVGLTSTEQALSAAHAQGYELKRIAPEVYGVLGIPHASCAIAPAIGTALARLVCTHRASELEDLLPYMTRGLPNEALGQRDLELELRVEPLRQRFASEIGSARLFAGFLVRELQLDSPRFDTALSDTAYALADELVAVVHDVNVIKLEATVSDEKRQLDTDFTIDFGDHKSWSASTLAEHGKHQGPAPEKFFAQPADAGSAGEDLAHAPARYDRMSAGLVELADAYLEHAKVGKVTRQRVSRLIETYFHWDGAAVTAAGSDAVESAKKGEARTSSDWSVLRLDAAPAALKGFLADFAAIVSDREARALVAHALKTEEKELATAKLVPLTGPNVPAGTKALQIKIPTELGPLFGRSFGLGSKGGPSTPSERDFAVVMNGTGAFVASASNLKVLGSRLGQAIAGKTPTLATRNDLGPLRSLQANWAGFATLLAVLSSSAPPNLGNASDMASGLPHHGQVPMFLDFQVEPQTGANARWHLAVPAGVFEDLPGLAPLLAAAFMGHHSSDAP